MKLEKIEIGVIVISVITFVGLSYVVYDKYFKKEDSLSQSNLDVNTDKVTTIKDDINIAPVKIKDSFSIGYNNDLGLALPNIDTVGIAGGLDRRDIDKSVFVSAIGSNFN